MVIKSDLPNRKTKLRNRLKLLQRKIRSLEGRAAFATENGKTKLTESIVPLKKECGDIYNELYGK